MPSSVSRRNSASCNLYVIAGPNGAGKTTFAREFLPNYADCRNFANVDLIAQGVSPFSPEAAAIRAGKLMLGEIEAFAQRRVDFGFETTLSGLSHLSLIRRLKQRGYRISIFYLWLPSANTALSRVKDRVARGGHNIAEPVVRRRFERSIRNFLCLYRQLADSWILFDNSGENPKVIAIESDSELRMADEALFNRLLNRYGEP
jgi:predicted ABC-type ATPase